MHHRPPQAILLSWLGLLALLALTVFSAYQPLGPFNTLAAIAIATGKALIVAVVFMELRDCNAMRIVFAGSGFFWLAILFWLSLADYTTRPNLPQRIGVERHDVFLRNWRSEAGHR